MRTEDLEGVLEQRAEDYLPESPSALEQTLRRGVQLRRRRTRRRVAGSVACAIALGAASLLVLERHGSPTVVSVATVPSTGVATSRAKATVERCDTLTDALSPIRWNARVASQDESFLHGGVELTNQSDNTVRMLVGVPTANLVSKVDGSVVGTSLSVTSQALRFNLEPAAVSTLPFTAASDRAIAGSYNLRIRVPIVSVDGTRAPTDCEVVLVLADVAVGG